MNAERSFSSKEMAGRTGSRPRRSGRRAHHHTGRHRVRHDAPGGQSVAAAGISAVVDGPEHLEALAERYAQAAAHLREGIDVSTAAGDASTADLLTEISRETDKALWFIEAHLQA